MPRKTPPLPLPERSPCLLGFGCDETGVCYASAHGKPENCGRSAQAGNDVMRKRAQEVAEDLQGTCKSLHDFATEEEQNDACFCAELDNLVFCCVTCGWWFEIGEMGTDTEGGELQCQGCADEEVKDACEEE